MRTLCHASSDDLTVKMHLKLFQFQSIFRFIFEIIAKMKIWTIKIYHKKNLFLKEIRLISAMFERRLLKPYYHQRQTRV